MKLFETKLSKTTIYLTGLLPIAGAVLFLLKPEFIIQLKQLAWLWLSLLALVLILPIRKITLTLPPNTQKHSFIKWISLIAGLQITLYFLLFNLNTLFSLTLAIPYGSIADTPIKSFADTLFFPWTLYTLSGCAIGYFCYNQQKDTRFSLLASSLLPKIKQVKKLRIILDNLMTTLINYFVIPSIFFVFSLLLLAIFKQTTGNIGQYTHTLNIPFMFATTIILIILQSKFWRKTSKRISQSGINFIKASLVACTILLTILILSLTLISGIFPSQQSIIDFHQWTSKRLWQQDRMIYLLIWKYLWVLLAGGFIAYVSKGYKLYSIILANLWLPLLVFVLKWIMPISLAIPANLMLLIQLVTFAFSSWFLSQTLFNKAHIGHVYTGILPASGQTKFRNYRRMFQLYVFGCIIMLIAYITSGSFIPTLLLSMSIPAILLIPIALFGWLKSLYQES